MHILTERFCHPPLCWLVKLNISHREKFFWEYNRESFVNTFSLRWLVWSPSGPYCHQSKTSANVERTLKRTLHCMLKRINKKHLSVKTKKSLVWDILNCHGTRSLSVVCLFNKAYTCWHQEHRSVFMRTSLFLNGMLLLLAQNCFALRERTESRTTWQAANNPGWRYGVCYVTLSKRFSASEPVVLIQEEALHKCTRRKQWTSNKSTICRNIFLVGKQGEIYITRIIYFNKDMYTSNIGNRFNSKLFGFKHN